MRQAEIRPGIAADRDERGVDDLARDRRVVGTLDDPLKRAGRPAGFRE
jgi:hypothetical protein